MHHYIGIEDLAANALIELMENDNKREVSFQALTQYGAAVVKVLNDRDKSAVLLLSRERTMGFIHDCTHFFDVKNLNTANAILALKENVTIDQIADEFCSSISTDVLEAFANEDALRALFAAA